MDTLGKIAIGLWTFILGGGALLIGLLIWGANAFMGDKFYSLEIQNGKDIQIKLKTYTTTQPGSKIKMDSVVMNPGDKFEIGTTHSCSTIDTMLIEIDAIEIFETNHKSKLIKKKALPDYLQTMTKVDCSTYSIR